VLSCVKGIQLLEYAKLVLGFIKGIESLKANISDVDPSSTSSFTNDIRNL